MTTREEERELVRRAKAGDNDALAQLLDGNEGLLNKIVAACGYSGQVMTSLRKDAMQEARIVVMGVLKDYEVDSVPFMAYAMPMLYWRIRDMRAKEGVIRTPRFQANKFCDATREKAYRARRILSINTPLRRHGNLTIGNCQPSSTNVMSDVIRNEELDRVMAAIRTLPRNQRSVIRLRMRHFEIKDIAKMIGVSRNTIAVWHKSGLARVRWLLTRSAEAA